MCFGTAFERMKWSRARVSFVSRAERISCRRAKDDTSKGTIYVVWNTLSDTTCTFYHPRSGASARYHSAPELRDCLSVREVPLDPEIIEAFADDKKNASV